MDPEEYDICIRDMEVAKSELVKMKLYPRNAIAEFYCIPSHNQQAYYALLSRKEDFFEFTYIKPHIYSYRFKGPVRMYPFVECKEAERHPAKQGQFIMGIKRLAPGYAEDLLNRLDFIPERYISEKIFRLDGVLQWIRLFE